MTRDTNKNISENFSVHNERIRMWHLVGDFIALPKHSFIRDRRMKLMQRAFVEKMRKFIFSISQYLKTGFSREREREMMLLNMQADRRLEFNISRHGREIIGGIVRRSKLRDEPNALKGGKFSLEVSWSIRTLHFGEQLRNVVTGFSCPGSAILLYHEILTDSRGMPSFQGRGRSILPTYGI